MSKETDLKYWLALIRTPLLGPQRGLNLIKKFSAIAEIFESKK